MFLASPILFQAGRRPQRLINARDLDMTAAIGMAGRPKLLNAGGELLWKPCWLHFHLIQASEPRS